MANQFFKRPGEQRRYRLSAARQPEIIDGDTIASITSVTATLRKGSGTLTIGATAVLSASVIAVWLSGGVDGSLYRIEATVVTAAGSTIVLEAPMKVTTDPMGQTEP